MRQNRTLVAEVKSNLSTFFTNPETGERRYLTGDTIIPLIRKICAHKMKTIHIPNADGTDKPVLTRSFAYKLKDCKTPVKVTFIFDK